MEIECAIRIQATWPALTIIGQYISNILEYLAFSQIVSFAKATILFDIVCKN